MDVMAGNFFDRLGGLFGRRPSQPTEEAPPADSSSAVTAEPTPEPVVESAPVADAPVTPGASGEAQAAPARPAETYAAPAAGSAAPPAPAYADTTSTVADASTPSAAVAEAAPAAPARSEEEQMEERLWGEVDQAWAAGNFEKVTELLDALKALEPEDAAAIDEKLAAAQYNYAAQIEQSGDLQRALYLYQEAQRRNPNLGEAAFAIERVQAMLQPPAPAEAEAQAMVAEAPAERTYTVESGDTLWAIAERMYGSGAEWQKIFEANRDQVDNPDLIQPGQTLRIP